MRDSLNVSDSLSIDKGEDEKQEASQDSPVAEAEQGEAHGGEIGTEGSVGRSQDAEDQ